LSVSLFISSSKPTCTITLTCVNTHLFIFSCFVDGPSRVAFCSASSSSGSVSCKGMITIEMLKDVAAGNPYKINNYLDDEGHTIPYDVLGNNCEHFVTFLRYGKSESKQNLFIGSGLLGGVAVVAAVAFVAAVASIKVLKSVTWVS
uniref:LRAT domain-containing protein n=1 Tax=Hucho hucho TaxID=62062 RepID=A0A4W5MCF1_9TELE